MSGRQTHHCSALAIDGHGVMIRGISGAGKSSLVLALLDHARFARREASLIGDDRLFLDVHEGRLIATVPPTIAGLIERYGRGIERHPYLESAAIDLVIDFVEIAAFARLPEPTELTCDICGLILPRQPVPMRRIGQAVALTLAALDAATCMPPCTKL